MIDVAPGRIELAPQQGTFSIDVTVFRHHVEKVVLLRPGAVTHHHDHDQRHIELQFSAPTGYAPNTSITITVTKPHESVGPPGYYTLWVVESTVETPSNYTHLVPSNAKIVHVR